MRCAICILSGMVHISGKVAFLGLKLSLAGCIQTKKTSLTQKTRFLKSRTDDNRNAEGLAGQNCVKFYALLSSLANIGLVGILKKRGCMCINLRMAIPFGVLRNCPWNKRRRKSLGRWYSLHFHRKKIVIAGGSRIRTHTSGTKEKAPLQERIHISVKKNR